MIITGSDPSDSKSSPPSDSTTTAQFSERSGDLSPPAYNPNLGSSMPAAPRMSLIRPPVAPKGHEPAGRRFAKAFFFAVLLYLLFAGLVKGVFHLTREHLILRQPDGPYDADGRVVRCAKDIMGLEFEDQRQYPAMAPPIFPPYTTTVLFSVPSSSHLIFFLSRGSYDMSSSVTFELSDNPGDDIEIEVAMSYFNNAALERARVCLLERDEGGKGVGIFTPKVIYPIPRESDRIKFGLTVRFPKSGSLEHPLVINALETHMGSWSHQILSLKHLVVFKTLSLRGSNALIRAQPVSADVAVFKTSNAPITGSYNVSTSLSLTTSNAPITANIWMENHDTHNPTQLNVKTSNGGIKTPITLLSTQVGQDDLWNPAAFSVNVKTSNSPLDVAFLDAPSLPFSVLDLMAKTTNSPANVKLHATYEGSFSLRTSSYFTATLVPTPGTQDPSGQGRHRIVNVRKVDKRRAIEGDVWWGDKNTGKGTVVVTTSNSNNVVELG